MHRIRIIGIAVLMAVVAAACGGGDDGGPAPNGNDGGAQTAGTGARQQGGSGVPAITDPRQLPPDWVRGGTAPSGTGRFQ